MPCYHPLTLKPDPKRVGQIHTVPCGRCIGCKLERSRQWAVRLMHEAQLHERTSFITLTYKTGNLPHQRATSSQSLTVARASPPLARAPHSEKSTYVHYATSHDDPDAGASLSRGDLQLFTKRLHMAATRKFGQGIRYFACGEYGDQTQRPHYHLAVYGEDFADDRHFYQTSKTGLTLWRSKRLAELWTYGDADIGELTFESAAYMARYITKKITGDKAHEHYKRIDADGNEYWIVPEFSVMSRRPGIGKNWIDKYRDSVYPHDRVILTRGDKRIPTRPPRYYDNQLKDKNQAEYDLVKTNREKFAKPAVPARLRAGEAITRARLKKRPLEK